MSKPETDALWAELASFAINPRHLKANKIITAVRDDPAYAAFDVLRTRILQPLKDNGWKRVAITSPTPDCGKSFTAMNLAITLSRYDNFRTVLMDMDLRSSSLHSLIGVRNPGSMGDYLRGLTTTEDHFRVPGANNFHIGKNLAIAMNGKREDYASELMQDPLTEEILEEMEDDLAPDIVLFDMPPVLTNDDVIAFRPQFDAALVVAGGGSTKANDLRLVERLLGEDKAILGVVLNKAEGSVLNNSYY
ncbi:MAG: CpsD/CapB family tyrosine-protein kinase [Rhodobacteraceae bacterium]|nr:CpsD/CapB family tyrosine-protein kinase [Paracoccaceae bacterium]